MANDGNELRSWTNRSTTEKLKLRDLPADWSRISRVRALAHVFMIWMGIVLVAMVCVRLATPTAYLLSLVIIGGLMNHLSSMIHHGIHCNLYPDRKINDALVRMFCAGPQGQIFSRLRREHLAHHARLGEPTDPEGFYYNFDRHNRRTPAGFVRWLFAIFLGWVAVPVLNRLITGRRDTSETAKPAATQANSDLLPDALAVVGAQFVLFLLFWSITGNPWGYALLWLVPLLTFGAGFNVLRATLEHANPRRPEELLFSFRSNPVERFFIGPLQFNYHYEHHRFMSIPYYNTPKVRQRLIESDDFGAPLVSSYLSHLRKTLRDLGQASAFQGG